jgi:hypothetical protein
MNLVDSAVPAFGAGVPALAAFRLLAAAISAAIICLIFLSNC